VVKATTGAWPQVAVDVEGYRARRRNQLESKARRAADKVKRSGQAAELPPMTASERKIVHQALTGLAGVRTESAGQGPERHIVIYPA
jgi:spoIIIJ-associated protein